MKPLSENLCTLLDRIAEVLARGEAAPDTLLTELESLWRIERPDDLVGLSTLVASLRAAPDDAHLPAGRNKDAGDRLDPPPAQPTPTDPFGADRGEDVAEGWFYPIFFGTNRAVRDPNQVAGGFSSRRAPTTSYGRCEVWIPRAHCFGETGSSWWRRWKRLEFSDDHLRLNSTAPLSETDFWAALRSEMANAEGHRPHGLVFLHGYNVGFEKAAIGAAQMGFDLGVSGATAFFSWPSQGSWWGYPADAAAIEASEDAITRFLVAFVRQSGAAVVHLVAHSMGNRGLLRALQRLSGDAELRAGVRFGQISSPPRTWTATCS